VELFVFDYLVYSPPWSRIPRCINYWTITCLDCVENHEGKNLDPPPSVFITGEPFGHQEIIYQFPRSSSVFTGESITKRNNSTNILQNSKSLPGVSAWTRRNFLIKKTEAGSLRYYPFKATITVRVKVKGSLGCC
jgi:hypothetical protein